jgi:primase-polymerase (primpol)-like protein
MFSVGTSPEVDPCPDHVALLKNRAQWLTSQYRQKDKDKKPRKVPINPANPKGPGIDKTDPKNWMSYDEARRHYEENPHAEVPSLLVPSLL